MSGFSSHWLALREPLDLEARNAEVENAFFGQLPAGPVRLLDLASGAGSTVAALAGNLSAPVDWQLTDYDSALLNVANERWLGRVSTRQVDLQRDLEQLSLADVDAVTTSAFLDLVSEAFLERLVAQITKAQKPFLASLTYDGRTEFNPSHTMDATLCTALNSHQRTDKGFGPALGPEAADRAMALFEAKGYRVVQGRSDWRAGPASNAFQLEFLSGWVRVGRELQLDASQLADWWRDRQEKIQAGSLNILVGHLDFVAFPARP